MASNLRYLSNKLKSKQEYRYVEAVDEKKGVYVGITVQLLTKEQFEEEAIFAEENNKKGKEWITIK